MNQHSSTHKFFTTKVIATITAIVVAFLAFFGIQLILGVGVFYHSRELVFADQTSALVRNFVAENLSELKLTNDLTISANFSTTAPEDTDVVVYNILVPVTDFNSGRLTITNAELLDLHSGVTEKDLELVSIWDLNEEYRLLSVDDNYYLDTFNSGAIFEYISLSGATKDIQSATALLHNAIDPFPNQSTVLTLAQTGVTALSRGMNAALSSVEAISFAENIAPILSSFDYAHTSNESSFSSFATSQNICSDPSMVDVLTAIGLDIVELTGNHNQDCGDEDAVATIDLYHSLGIQTYGGGKTATAAAEPIEISAKDSNITMLGYNLSTGGYTTDNTPGANFYTEAKAKQDISEAKAQGNFVIVDIQYYECNNYNVEYESTVCDYADSAAGDQIGFFRHLIDLGADIVVGTSAHQPQTFELYKDGAIYYGLGNLFFDQSWWPGTTRSLILVHYFYEGNLLQTRIMPTVYDSSYQTKLMDTSDAETFLSRLIKAQP